MQDDQHFRVSEVWITIIEIKPAYLCGFGEQALRDYKHTHELKKAVITIGVAVVVCFSRSVR